MENLNPPAIVGEAVAGEAAATLKQVKQLVKGMSTNTFDLAELLYKIKKNKFYAPKYETFGEYAKTLDLKITKAYYLARLVEVMEASGVTREQYEPVGIAKLRIITRLDPSGEYQGLPNTHWVSHYVAHSNEYTPEQLGEAIATVQGVAEEDAFGWVNFPIKKTARTLWEQAVQLAIKNIGSVGQDADGKYKDASVGAAAEVIALSYLQDPNNFGEELDTNQN